MSSIGGADRNSQDESVRRARETYEQREAENIKKQKAEMRKMTETHQSEVLALRDSHDKQLAELKEKAKDALTRRDMEYQRDVNEMRGIHREQLRRAAQESEDKSTRVEETLKGELARSQAIDERQKAQLRESFETEIRNRDNHLEAKSKESREEIAKGLDANRRRLNAAHEKEKDAIVKDRDRRLENAQMGYDELRKVKDSTIANERAQREMQVERLGRNFQSQIRNNHEDNAARQDIQREAFGMGLKESRERYKKALDKNAKAMEDARGDLTETVNGRMNRKIAVLEDELSDAQRVRDREKASLEAKKSLEVRNLRDAFQKNVDEYERQNKGLRQESNLERAQEIKRVNEQNAEALIASNRFYQEKIGLDDVRNEERFSKSKSDFEAKLQNMEASSGSRFEKLKNFNSLEQEKMRAYFDQATASMRENFETTLREMRMRQKAEQDQLFAGFAKQNREVEEKNQGRLQDLTMRYEKQIADMSMKHQKAIKEERELAARQFKEQERKFTGEMATQNSQLEYRIAKNEDSHKRELDDMKRKHQESLANIIKTRQS